MRVAVTGASGIVGRFVVARLLREECEITGLARAGTDRGGFGGRIDWVDGDVRDRAALAVLVGGADGLVHCAFEHVAGRYRGGEGDDVAGFWRVNLGGTVDLLEAAAGAGIGRTVLLSSRAVFGRPAEGPIGDTHPTSPTTHYGALKAASEALANVYEGVTVLRPTGVYGIVRSLERTKWLDLARAVLEGRSPTESRAGTEVYGGDVADAVWRLLTAPASVVAGHVFNCSDLEVDTRDVVARIQAVFEREGPLPPAAPAVRTVLRCERLRALGWRPGGDARLQAEIEALCARVRERAGAADSARDS